MFKQVSASDAKNNFGGLLDDVAALGCIEIMKHGRLVAVVVSPRAFSARPLQTNTAAGSVRWGQRHMIPPASARAARRLHSPEDFDAE